MEIMGLAVIVILLALGMFFVTKFTVLDTSRPSSTVTSEQKKIASSFILSFLNSHTDCGQSTFTDVVLEMQELPNTNLVCPDSNITRYVRDSVRFMLNETKNMAFYDYKVSIVFPTRAPIVTSQLNGVNQIVLIDKNCSLHQNEEPVEQPIPGDYSSSGDYLAVRMSICY
jgi:hypothetical protein